MMKIKIIVGFLLCVVLTTQVIAGSDRSQVTFSFARLTEEEFKQLVPWYDLTQQTPNGLGLHTVNILIDESEQQTLLVIYSDGERYLTVNINGERNKVRLQHGPSEFEVIYPTASSQVVTPWLSSQRTGVRLSIVGQMDSNDTADFLQRLILHPAANTL